MYDISSSMPPKGGWVGNVAFTLRTVVFGSHGVLACDFIAVWCGTVLAVQMEGSGHVLDNTEISLSSLPGVFWVAGSRSGNIRRTVPIISLIDETSHVPEFSTPRLEDLDDDSIPGFGGWELSAAGDSRGDTAVSSSDYARILFDASLRLQDDMQLSLPWESGVMAAIFGDDTDSIFPSPCPPVEPGFSSVHSQELQQHAEEALEPTRTAVRGIEIDVPMYSLAIKVKPDRNFTAELDWLWDKAPGKWLQVFERCGFPGVLGDALSGQMYAADDAAAGLVLRDALGIKSPRTSLKRAQTLIRYFQWLQQNFETWDPWSREHCLQYIVTPGPKGIVARRGTALREALKFAHYVLDFQIPLELLEDAQIRGRADRLQAEAEESASARPLTADEVRRLEKMMESSMCVTDKYLLGGVLFAIFSRSRWSDLQVMSTMGSLLGSLRLVQGTTRRQRHCPRRGRLSGPWDQWCSLDSALAGYFRCPGYLT